MLVQRVFCKPINRQSFHWIIYNLIRSFIPPVLWVIYSFFLSFFLSFVSSLFIRNYVRLYKWDFRRWIFSNADELKDQSSIKLWMTFYFCLFIPIIDFHCYWVGRKLTKPLLVWPEQLHFSRRQLLWPIGMSRTDLTEIFISNFAIEIVHISNSSDIKPWELGNSTRHKSSNEGCTLHGQESEGANQASACCYQQRLLALHGNFFNHDQIRALRSVENRSVIIVEFVDYGDWCALCPLRMLCYFLFALISFMLQSNFCLFCLFFIYEVGFLWVCGYLDVS